MWRDMFTSTTTPRARTPSPDLTGTATAASPRWQALRSARAARGLEPSSAPREPSSQAATAAISWRPTPEATRSRCFAFFRAAFCYRSVEALSRRVGWSRSASRSTATSSMSPTKATRSAAPEATTPDSRSTPEANWCRWRDRRSTCRPQRTPATSCSTRPGPISSASKLVPRSRALSASTASSWDPTG